MINIVTAICVDQDFGGKNISYPQVSGFVNRRELYWKLVTVFCCTSLKFNPSQNHLVFTNDTEDIVIDKVDVRQFLRDKGVKIINLPFKEFDPAEHSRHFRNAFYKLEVVKALGNEEHSSILLDSDCIWARPAAALISMLEEGTKLLLIDTYQRKDPLSKQVHNLSMQDMGDVYKSITPGYPVANPVWYGGEAIGGSPAHFKQVAAGCSAIFHTIIHSGKEYVFANGKSVFDNDEFISSYVYNQLEIPAFDMWNVFLRRMWTSPVFTDIVPGDYALPIWHLPAEKETGLSLLYQEITRKKSKFDKTDNLPEFLGERTGILERKYRVKKSFKEIIAAIKRKVY